MKSSSTGLYLVAAIIVQVVAYLSFPKNLTSYHTTGTALSTDKNSSYRREGGKRCWRRGDTDGSMGVLHIHSLKTR